MIVLKNTCFPFKFLFVNILLPGYRMCLQCGVPKTFSGARGMVCPICGDRPPNDTSNESKKKGSTIKDKEKSKRMKGQSSHAAWKSETEMQLRQQFD